MSWQTWLSFCLRAWVVLKKSGIDTLLGRDIGDWMGSCSKQKIEISVPILMSTFNHPKQEKCGLPAALRQREWCTPGHRISLCRVRLGGSCAQILCSL